MEFHITEFEIEQYVLARLNNEVKDRLNEHLLICEQCRGLLIEEESRILGLYKALSEEERRIREKECLPIDELRKRLRSKLL